jgi:hypothetical protein
MPRNYDDYLYDSLCHSEDDVRGPPHTDSSIPVRRNSISEGLAPIPIVVEGSGIVVKMRVKPHVRWTKILAKWSAAFTGDPPMAWPISIRIPSDSTSIPCKSIQESISRTLGPELLGSVLDKDPALIIAVGGSLMERSEPHTDVVPPIFPILSTTEAQSVTIEEPCKIETGIVDPTPVPTESTEKPDTKRTYKIRIESVIFKKPIKMSVSGGCSVSRLIRKYLDALKQTDNINPDIVSLSYSGKMIEGLDLTMSGMFGDSCEGIVIEALVGKPNATPKRRRRQSSEGRSSSVKSRKIESEQANELAYWEQVRSVRKDPNREDEDDDDDDLALAIALSLSTETTK